MTLEELTKGPKPLLRKVYKDPITGEDWEYIREVETGRIKGVRSRAKMAPIKQHQFPQAVFHFEGLTLYHDWVFQYPSASTSQTPQGLLPEGGPTGSPPTSSQSQLPPVPIGTPSTGSLLPQ